MYMYFIELIDQPTRKYTKINLWMIFNTTDSTSTPNFSNEKLIWSFKNITILIICGLITIFTILGESNLNQLNRKICSSLILGNGLVLISIKFRLRARSYSDYFIVSLCLADFFVGLFVMPLMTIHTLYVNWPYHYRLCYLWMSIDFTCSTASFLTLASMSLDRYWALTGINLISFDELIKLDLFVFSTLFSFTKSFIFICFDIYNQFMGYSICYLAKFNIHCTVL